jgi:hypothetical protein
MYCPQCSQEQVAAEMRFCSRCGFPLTIVSQLVTGGGALEGFDAEGKHQLSPRQRGVRKGALFMIISGVLIPIVALLSAMKSDLAVLFLPVLMVLVYGLARLLYAYLLEQSTSRGSETSLAGNVGSKQLSAAHRSALPPQQSAPITDWRQPRDTSEMAQAPSVTDQTTKLLNGESEPVLRNRKQ